MEAAMDLAFGTNVREHGYRIGRLTGLELGRGTRVIRHIVISEDGAQSAQAEQRPLAAVPMDHFDGDMVLNFLEAEPQLVAGETVRLTGETRVTRGGRDIGRLSSVELSPETGEIVSITGRQHWWTRRFEIPAAGLDF